MMNTLGVLNHGFAELSFIKYSNITKCFYKDTGSLRFNFSYSSGSKVFLDLLNFTYNSLYGKISDPVHFTRKDFCGLDVYIDIRSGNLIIGYSDTDFNNLIFSIFINNFNIEAFAKDLIIDYKRDFQNIINFETNKSKFGTYENEIQNMINIIEKELERRE